jgi:hypothetical protein
MQYIWRENPDKPVKYTALKHRVLNRSEKSKEVVMRILMYLTVAVFLASVAIAGLNYDSPNETKAVCEENVQSALELGLETPAHIVKWYAERGVFVTEEEIQEHIKACEGGK